MVPTLSTLLDRNASFARHSFVPNASLMPTLRTVVIGCADARVDPSRVLGIADGEALVIRNIGGRVTPATMQTLAALRAIGAAQGGPPGPGWSLVLLQHTDCGITRLTGQRELVAGLFGVPSSELGDTHLDDPRAAVAGDVDVLRANPLLPASFEVSGLVYDVRTGRVEVVVEPALLRKEQVVA